MGLLIDGEAVDMNRGASVREETFTLTRSEVDLLATVNDE